MFQWEREVAPSWQADLDRLSVGERVSKLAIHWVSGMPYEPVQRFAIWEIVPVSAVGKILDDEQHAGIDGSLFTGLWKDLHGPDPRTTGKWIPDPTVTGGRRWSSKSLVSRMQWSLHKQYGGFPVLCWIIEGRHGGHAWQFGHFEQAVLLAAGADPELVQAMADAWPNPGSQPYADYDARVFHALAERDLLTQWRKSLAWEDRANRTQAGLILMGEAADRRADILQRVMRWMDNQVSDAVSDIPRTLLPPASAFAPGGVPSDTEEDQLHHYLTEH